jgi:hypothetical protein
MSRRRFALLATILVSVNVFFWLAQGGAALPRALFDRLFGPQMVRSEVVVADRFGGTKDFRVDRGVIASISPGQIVLRERDGTMVEIPVRPRTRVATPNGPRDVRMLRPGMRVLAIRPVNEPAVVINLEGRP